MLLLANAVHGLVLPAPSLNVPAQIRPIDAGGVDRFAASFEKVQATDGTTALVFPSMTLAKSGSAPSYDYTRGLEDLNGIDIWADIPGQSENVAASLEL